MQKKDDFAKGLSTVLIEYGLGRPIGFTDDALVKEMMNTVKSRNYGFREFIHSLVSSREFHTK